MKIGGLLDGLWHGISKNATHLLTAGGIIGIFATVYFAVEAGANIAADLEDAQLKAYPEEPTKKKVLQIACKNLWPVAVSAAAATACAAGSDILATKRIAACGGAYTRLEQNFMEYKAAAIGALGLGANQKIQEYQDKQKDIPAEEPELPEGYHHFYDAFSRNTYVAKLEDVQDAQYAINRQLADHGHCCANDYYRLQNTALIDRGEDLEWDYDELADYWGIGWIDFENVRHEEEDGSVWYTVRMKQPPTIDGLIDWDAWIVNQYSNVSNVLPDPDE